MNGRRRCNANAYHCYTPHIAATVQTARLAASPGVTVISKFLRRLSDDLRAATAIEYTLIAGMIAVVAVMSFSAIGGRIQSLLPVAANGMI